MKTERLEFIPKSVVKARAIGQPNPGATATLRREYTPEQRAIRAAKAKRRVENLANRANENRKRAAQGGSVTKGK